MSRSYEDWPDLSKTTSNEDCKFLKGLCQEFNPKKILEIGTFVGKSTYAMASGSDCPIYTIDKDKDRFLRPEKYKKLTDKIITHPRMDSIDFWKNYPDLNGFDFIFIDGWLRQEDVENIFQRSLDNFWFVSHDYNYDKYGDQEKGYKIVNRMLKEGMKRNYDFDISKGGECCGFIKFRLDI